MARRRKRWVVRDGLRMLVGGRLWRWDRRELHGGSASTTTELRRRRVIEQARKLIGIREVPPGSNDGPDVHRIQTSTGAFDAAWCVSTVQYIWREALGSTWADRTANAYYLADYAERHGCAIRRPVPGCAVVYHLGAGHAGTVVGVNEKAGTFQAVEGNEADAVELVTRDPRSVPCTFILRPELR